MADTKVINGVKTIDYRGKSYVEVAERLRHVHEQKREFQVLDSEVYEIAGRVLCRVTISVDGKIFKGVAEAKVNNAAPRSADASNPFECGETSALGRALAFAGLGTVDSIASYDEMTRSVPLDDNAQSNGGVANPPARPTPPAPAQPKPATPAPTETARLDAIPTPQQLRKQVEEGKFTVNGEAINWPTFLAMAFSNKIKSGGITVKQLVEAGSELPPKYCQHAALFLRKLQESKAA